MRSGDADGASWMRRWPSTGSAWRPHCRARSGVHSRWGTAAVRRLGWGPVRDTVLQVRYVSAAGEVVKAGGPTVKNVSGFDLCRLLVGSRGTLGFIADVILRTRPRPMAEQWFTSERDPWALLGELYRPTSVLWNGTTTWVLLEGHPADVEQRPRRSGCRASPNRPTSRRTVGRRRRIDCARSRPSDRSVRRGRSVWASCTTTQRGRRLSPTERLVNCIAGSSTSSTRPDGSIPASTSSRPAVMSGRPEDPRLRRQPGHRHRGRRPVRHGRRRRAWRLPDPVLHRAGMNVIFACGRGGAARRCAHDGCTGVDRVGELSPGARVCGFRRRRGTDVIGDGGLSVTAWDRIEASDAPIDWSAVGEMVRRVHGLSPSMLPESVPLPRPEDFPVVGLRRTAGTDGRRRRRRGPARDRGGGRPPRRLARLHRSGRLPR